MLVHPVQVRVAGLGQTPQRGGLVAVAETGSLGAGAIGSNLAGVKVIIGETGEHDIRSIAVCYILLGSPCDRMAMRASINLMM
jgi:hypothetical protein